MKTVKIILCAFFAFIFITGCSDDESRSEMILGQWKVVAFSMVMTGSTTPTDVFATFQACRKDDLNIFETGGVYKEDEGPTKCDPSDPQQTTGTWSFNSDETVLTLVSDGITTVINVTEMSKSKLVGTVTESTGVITATLNKI